MTIPRMRNKISGYLLGLIFSTVAAVLTIVAAIYYLQGLMVRCAMSLGCPSGTGFNVLLWMLGGYLLIAAVLAVFARYVFKSRPGVAFLLNVAPLMAIIAIFVLWGAYRDYSHERRRTLAIQTAISDAPAIHLGEPYVKRLSRRPLI